jgi:hypothetical protein
VPRPSATRAYIATIGAALGSIIATIITAHIRKVSHNWLGDHGEAIDIPGIAAIPAIPPIPGMPSIAPAGIRHKYSQASAESAPRPPQIASWSGSRSARAILGASVVGSAEAIANFESYILVGCARQALVQLIGEKWPLRPLLSKLSE